MRHLIRHEYEMPAQLLRARGLLQDDDHSGGSEQPDDEDEVRMYGGLNPHSV